jgi:DNA-binding CsgD family transcriptional regulator
VNTPTWSVRWFADPADRMPADSAERMKRYVMEQPLVQYHWDNSGARPAMLSDFMGQRELRRTALYKEFYGPIGINYQMSISLRVGRSLALGLSLSRTKQDFTERERDLLDVVQPHIMQAYRNAEMVSLLSKNGASNGGQTAAAECLSSRERQVLLLLAEDRTNADIARSLYLSPRTVQKHLEHIYGKLGVHSRSGAVARALEVTRSA